MTGRAAGYPPLSVGFIGATPASKITECITEPAPLVVILSIWIKHALNVAVQRSHDAYAREHRRAARRRDQDQRFHCSLPFLGPRLGLRKLS
jgi:hypothetical protein